MRFSLATMLLVTAYAAFACVALVQPAFHWTSILWNTSLVILALAAVGAAATQGHDRAYWIGFAVCGWAHYLLSLSPWTGGKINAYIFSRAVLDLLCVLLQHQRTLEVYEYDRVSSTQPPMYFFINMPQAVQVYVYFMISGFALFSVASGVIGGWLASWLFSSFQDKPIAESNNHPASDTP